MNLVEAHSQSVASRALGGDKEVIASLCKVMGFIFENTQKPQEGESHH
jgi:hypothetical protein